MKFLSGLATCLKLLKQTFIGWWARDPFRDSATIAYYTIFSLPGLMIVIISLAGYFFGNESVTSQLLANIEEVMGKKGAQIINNVISNTQTQYDLTFTSLAGGATLLFGATAVFAQVQKSLNNIWEIEPQPKQVIFKFLRDRLFSFGIIVTIGFLMLVSLLLSTSISALSSWIGIHFSVTAQILVRLFDVLISLGAITCLFAAIFKILPDVQIGWRDVFVGALITSILFIIGKFSIAFYLAHSDPTSAYGAAGSLVLVMLWVSYGSLLLLLGAEFTRVHYLHRGNKIKKTKIADAAS